MNNWIKVFGISLCMFLSGNSCSSGADPDAIILDVFSVPAENCLQIQNVLNDLAMDVNGILMHNLDLEQDTIKENVASCVNALIYRNELTSKLDSMVLDYGTSYCSSNGGRFKGKVIVLPQAENLKLFSVGFFDFFASGYKITGNISMKINGDIAGRDFSHHSTDLSFLIENTEFRFTLNEYNSTYIFINDEEGNANYMDDIYQFTSSFSGETPDAISFTFDNQIGLTYAYSCNQIIGGKASFVLTDVGNGSFDFGGGDPTDDCDNVVKLIGETANTEFKL